MKSRFLRKKVEKKVFHKKVKAIFKYIFFFVSVHTKLIKARYIYFHFLF